MGNLKGNLLALTMALAGVCCAYAQSADRAAVKAEPAAAVQAGRASVQAAPAARNGLIVKDTTRMRPFAQDAKAPKANIVCILQPNVKDPSNIHRCSIDPQEGGTDGGTGPSVCGPQVCTEETTIDPTTGQTSTVVSCNDPTQGCADADMPQGPTALPVGGNTCQAISNGLGAECDRLPAQQQANCRQNACVQEQECANPGKSSTAACGNSTPVSGSGSGSTAATPEGECAGEFAANVNYCAGQADAGTQTACLSVARSALHVCILRPIE